MNQYFGMGRSLKPTEDAGWDDKRVLSAEFLTTVLLSQACWDVLPFPGIRIIGAWFKQELNLSDATIDRTLKIEWSRFDKPVYLMKVKTDREISFQGSAFKEEMGLSSSEMGNLILEGINIKGRLWIHAAKIKGQIALTEAHMGRDTYIGSSEVSETIWLTGSTFEGRLLLVGTRVRLNVDLSGVSLGDADLSNAKIEGFLKVGVSQISNTPRRRTRWRSGSMLVLRSAWVRDINTPPDLEVWPGVLEMGGVTYNWIFHGPDPSREMAGGLSEDTSLAQRVEWFSKWLGRSRHFSPQPYRQLAGVFRERGYEGEASQILYAGRERERREARGLQWLWLTALWAFIGYGLYPYYAGCWYLLLLVVGAFLFGKTPEGRAQNVRFGLAYSFDALTPGITLSKVNKELEIGGRLQYYFYFHKVMGFVLAFFLIAALTGLVK